MQFLSELIYWPQDHLHKKYPRPAVDFKLIGSRVMLRMADPADWKSWRALRDMSRDMLQPWEPTWSPNGLNHSFFCGMLRRQWREWRQGIAYNFLIFRVDEMGKPGALVGGITLNGVERGIAQKGTIGYWIGRPFVGQGYMREAAELVCDFAFQTLRLNRVEASCLPHNEPSKNLLNRLGFVEEGYAKSYLQINGVWEDHLLWGKTKGA